MENYVANIRGFRLFIAKIKPDYFHLLLTEIDIANIVYVSCVKSTIHLRAIQKFSFSLRRSL